MARGPGAGRLAVPEATQDVALDAQHLVPEVVVVRRAGDLLHDEGEQRVAGVGVEELGARGRRLLEAAQGGDGLVLGERLAVGADLAGQTAGVEQELLDGHPGRRAPEPGEEIPGAVIEGQLVGGRQVEHGGGGEGLGDRADGEDGVEGVGAALLLVGQAVGGLAIELRPRSRGRPCR